MKAAENGRNWTNAVHEITMPFRNYAMSFEFIRLVRLYLGFRTYSFDLRSFTLILRHYGPSKKTDDLDKNDPMPRTQIRQPQFLSWKWPILIKKSQNVFFHIFQFYQNWPVSISVIFNRLKFFWFKIWTLSMSGSKVKLNSKRGRYFWNPALYRSVGLNSRRKKL